MLSSGLVLSHPENSSLERYEPSVICFIGCSHLLTKALSLPRSEREKQKSFVVIEEPRAPKPLRPPTSSSQNDPDASKMISSGLSRSAEKAEQEDDIGDEEDDEEERFDIDE